MPERAVADVDDVGPQDREGIDAQGVAVVEVVVEECRGEVVGGPDGVDVAGQVQVEVLHREDLAVAAARRTALDPEDGAEGWLADRRRRGVADPGEALHEPDRRGALALAERRRGDRGDEDVATPWPLGLEALDGGEADLRLHGTVQLQLVGADPELVGNGGDRTG